MAPITYDEEHLPSPEEADDDHLWTPCFSECMKKYQTLDIQEIVNLLVEHECPGWASTDIKDHNYVKIALVKKLCSHRCRSIDLKD